MKRTIGFCGECKKWHGLDIEPERLVGVVMKCDCGGFVDFTTEGEEKVGGPCCANCDRWNTCVSGLIGHCDFKCSTTMSADHCYSWCATVPKNDDLVVSAEKYLSGQCLATSELHYKYADQLRRAFGDQLLGFTRGVNFPGFREDRATKFLVWEHEMIKQLKGMIGERKFWVRRVGLKENLFVKSINRDLPESLKEASPEAFVCGRTLYEPMRLVVLRIFFAPDDWVARED